MPASSDFPLRDQPRTESGQHDVDPDAILLDARLTKFDNVSRSPNERPHHLKQGRSAGVNGAILKQFGPGPAGDAPLTGFVCSVNISSIDESTAAVKRLDGRITLPKMQIPGVGWVGYAKDTEGNIFGMIQPEQ